MNRKKKVEAKPKRPLRLAIKNEPQFLGVLSTFNMQKSYRTRNVNIFDVIYRILVELGAIAGHRGDADRKSVV